MWILRSPVIDREHNSHCGLCAYTVTVTGHFTSNNVEYRLQISVDV